MTDRSIRARGDGGRGRRCGGGGVTGRSNTRVSLSGSASQGGPQAGSKELKWKCDGNSQVAQQACSTREAERDQWFSHRREPKSGAPRGLAESDWHAPRMRKRECRHRPPGHLAGYECTFPKYSSHPRARARNKEGNLQGFNLNRLTHTPLTANANFELCQISRRGRASEIPACCCPPSPPSVRPAGSH